MKTTTQTTETLLSTAAALDTDRRWKAVGQFAGYRVVGNRVHNLKSGAVYTVGMDGVCSCPDSQFRLSPLRAKMAREGVATACRCRHFYIGRLLTGRSVKVGSSTFTALRK